MYELSGIFILNYFIHLFNDSSNKLIYNKRKYDIIKRLCFEKVELIMYETYHSGWIECITGSMFSGKSEELIRRLRRGMLNKSNRI